MMNHVKLRFPGFGIIENAVRYLQWSPNLQKNQEEDTSQTGKESVFKLRSGSSGCSCDADLYLHD